jgi:hypothetical protein
MDQDPNNTLRTLFGLRSKQHAWVIVLRKASSSSVLQNENVTSISLLSAEVHISYKVYI